MIIVYKNNMLPRVNPKLYRFMMSNGFTSDPTIYKDTKSLYMIDGNLGLFVTNDNFAYVLCGTNLRNGGEYYLQNEGYFIYHLKNGKYSNKGTYHIGKPFYLITDDSDEANDEKLLKYRSEVMRTALKVIAKHLPPDYAPNPRDARLFPRESTARAYDAVDTIKFTR